MPPIIWSRLIRELSRLRELRSYLATTPLAGQGVGMGQVNIVPIGSPIGNDYTFEVTISLPVAFNESLFHSGCPDGWRRECNIDRFGDCRKPTTVYNLDSAGRL